LRRARAHQGHRPTAATVGGQQSDHATRLQTGTNADAGGAARFRNPNSLWRNGSRAFFKDQRTHQIGETLTMKVNITDNAIIENETKRSRDSKDDSNIENFF